MNTTESAQFGGRTASIEMKTDLNLLLECLKFQMDNPDSQKETLVAVRSICQNNSDASDYFREIGGLIFVNNLAKSSAHTILKEASLYTLGVLAESNVYCQQTLCTLDLFEDVHAVLSNKQFAVNLKRMSVFILLVLVSNNKTGQTLARESRCIDILLILFSKMLTRNMVLPTESTNQQYHLWSSICSALCSCVNNPQNEENQKLCSSAFPQANEWLQHSIQPAITRPICSLIGLTTANNSFAQDYFASVGGLDTLAEVLLQLVKGVQAKRSSIRLAVAVTKTLDACIAENLTAIHHLSEHGVVSSLISLLSCGHLEAEDMFSIVLTVGHCTEDCEPNQYELLKCNGLPLMIQVLSESKDDELHKAATFVLQNCRHITETLSLNLNEHTPSIKLTSNQNKRDKCMAEYWKNAKVIYDKIEHLQKQYDENISNIEEPGRTENISSRYRKAVSAPGRAIVPCFPKNVADHDIAQKSQNNCSNASQCLNRGVSACRESVPLEKVRRQIFPHTATQQNSSASGRTSKSPSHSCITIQEASTDLPCRAQKLNSDSYRNNLSLRDAVTQTVPYDMTKTLPADLHRSQGETLEEAEQTTSTCSITTLRLNAAKQSTANNAGINIDPLTLCADIIDKEISGILGTRVLLTELRCSGCLATDFVMNSRNCSKILQECSHLCDRHRIILQAEERYKTEFKKVMRGTGCSIAHKQLTPIRRAGAVLQNESNSSRILLTPIRKVINEDKHHKKAVCFLHKPPPQ
ncbi:telomere repeats-binding bouquet formation protein 1 isoform X2 [Pseudophryne corroboree]|uniref:telomere repeats-binding bouquet formation protein 1 isoform X2 n=1 Tax=Pseudophryne corroboree TaxID=495146 RepID=UPI003081CD97